MKAGERMTHEQRAVAKNKRMAKRWPLLALAGALPQVTAKDVEELEVKALAALAAMEKTTTERAARWERELAALVTDAEMGAIRQHRLILPRSPEYAADLYHRALNVILICNVLRGLGEVAR